MLQRTQLARYAALFRFLERHEPAMADEVRRVYVESMGATLHDLFRAYQAALAKLDLAVADRNDLIAVAEDAVRSPLTSRVSLAKRGDGFALGDRARVLDAMGAPPILVHVAQAERAEYPFEELFRSSTRHLADAAASEAAFVRAFFFGEAADADGRVRRILDDIFRRAFSTTVEHLENKLFACHDVVGLLLVLKVVAAARRAAERRDPAARVDALEKFFVDCEKLVRPRLDALFAANVASVRDADPQRLGAPTVLPHYVARRYAELHAAVLSLFPAEAAAAGNGGGSAAATAVAAASALRVGVDGLLSKLAARLREPKDRVVFLINNYDQILSIFGERGVARGADLDDFARKLAAQRETFVEDALAEGFAKMIAFVKATEAAMRDAAEKPLELDAALVDRLTRDFAATWKTAIARVNEDVLTLFASFVNGMEVLKQVLTQLLLYYTRFQEIVRRAWRRPPPFAKNLVPTATILGEIKKYSRQYD